MGPPHLRLPTLRMKLSPLLSLVLAAVCQAQEPFCVAQDVDLVPAGLGAFETFGRAVALDGLRAAVGSSTSRRVTLFTRDNLTWSEESVLQPTTAGMGWGSAVALDDATLVVGAPFDATDGTDAGSVTVFSFDGNAWTEDATLTPSDAGPGRRFGLVVQVDGDTIAVGSPGDGLRGVTGAAYVFERSGGVWTEQDRLEPLSGAVSEFGSAVALSLPRLLVGSPDTDRVHTFTRSGSAWNEGPALAPAGTGSGFGWSVDVQGTRAVVGAPFDDTIATNAGAVHVWEFNGLFWLPLSILHASDAVERDGFGVAVALDGPLFLVGADGAPSVGSSGTILAPGHAYLFADRGGTWLEQARFERPNGGAGEFFGRALDLDRDVALVGSAGASDQGLLSGAATTWRVGASQTAFGDGLAGSGGLTPTVSLSSCAAVNQSFDIVIENGLGGAPGILIWSDQSASIGFAGGVIVVGFPLFNQIPHVLGGSLGVAGEGTASFPVFVDNDGVIGQRLVLQAGYLDPGAPNGISLSTGLDIQFPVL